MEKFGSATQRLIERYGMIPHPEGGFFQEYYRSCQEVTSGAVAAPRQAVTHIHFLLARGQVSRFHQVRHDEIWHFYEGAPLRLVIFDGLTAQERLLGSEISYVIAVPGGLFQAAETTGDYSLVGCTVAPGFEYEDFSFLADAPDMVLKLERNAFGYRRFL